MIIHLQIMIQFRLPVISGNELKLVLEVQGSQGD